MQWYHYLIIGIPALCLLYTIIALALVKPNKKRDMSVWTGIRIAHRGLFDNTAGCPENSLAAFREARKHNTAIELDVQFTKDKKLIVFHDNDLLRLCGVAFKICDLTYAQISEYTLLDTDERIPLFTDALAALDGVPVVCEIKSLNDEPNGGLCQTVCNQMEGYKGPICIESFSPGILRWFKQNRPDIIRGQLSCLIGKNPAYSAIKNHFRITSMANLYVNALSRPDFVAYHYTSYRFFGCMLCDLWRPVKIAWTAVGEKNIEKAFKTFDSVIFENEPANPETIKK